MSWNITWTIIHCPKIINACTWQETKNKTKNGNHIKLMIYCAHVNLSDLMKLPSSWSSWLMSPTLRHSCSYFTRWMHYHLLKKAQMYALLSTEESTDACIAIFWRKHECMYLTCYWRKQRCFHCNAGLLKKAQMHILLYMHAYDHLLKSRDACIAIYWRKQRCLYCYLLKKAQIAYTL